MTVRDEDLRQRLVLGEDPQGPRNLDPRLALETQCRDAGNDANRRGPELSMQPRTAVCQDVGAFGPIPRDPRAHHSRTDARGSGDEVRREVVVEHASDQVGSTRGGSSGILMDVHYGPSG